MILCIRGNTIIFYHFVIRNAKFFLIERFRLDVLKIYFDKKQCCCGRGDTFQGPRVGSCLTVRNELSEETCADKTRDFIGKGHPGGEQQGQGTQENSSATWLAVLGFMGMELVSGLSLAKSFWLRVLPGDTRIAQPRWMPARRILGGGWTRGVSWTLSVSAGLLVPCSLPGPPVVN